jgi:hypothetical protein
MVYRSSYRRRSFLEELLENILMLIILVIAVIAVYMFVQVYAFGRRGFEVKGDILNWIDKLPLSYENKEGLKQRVEDVYDTAVTPAGGLTSAQGRTVLMFEYTISSCLIIVIVAFFTAPHLLGNPLAGIALSAMLLWCIFGSLYIAYMGEGYGFLVTTIIALGIIVMGKEHYVKHVVIAEARFNMKDNPWLRARIAAAEKEQYNIIEMVKLIRSVEGIKAKRAAAVAR